MSKECNKITNKYNVKIQQVEIVQEENKYPLIFENNSNNKITLPNILGHFILPQIPLQSFIKQDKNEQYHLKHNYEDKEIFLITENEFLVRHMKIEKEDEIDIDKAINSLTNENEITNIENIKINIIKIKDEIIEINDEIIDSETKSETWINKIKEEFRNEKIPITPDISIGEKFINKIKLNNQKTIGNEITQKELINNKDRNIEKPNNDIIKTNQDKRKYVSAETPSKPKNKPLTKKEAEEILFKNIEEYRKNFTNDDIEFLRLFNFTDCDIDKNERIRLFKLLVKEKKSYSRSKYDLGKVQYKFDIKLKPGGKLKRQRPSRVNIHQRERLNILLGKLIEAGIISEAGNNGRDDTLGSECTNPVIIIAKGETLKLVLDARFLNANTDLSNYTWPLEPMTYLMDRIRGSIFTASDASCAYHQIELTERSKPHTAFEIGNRAFHFNNGFYGLQGLPSFFSLVMLVIFRPMIEKGTIITYLDDVLIMAKTKEEMFENIQEFHILLRKSKLKMAPDKTLLFQKKLQYLGHIISGEGRQPINKRVEAIKMIKTPENKKQLLGIIGQLSFYRDYFPIQLFPKCRPFFDLVKDDTIWKWTNEDEKLLREVLEVLSANTILTIPDPEFPFEIHTDSSNRGCGCMLVNVKTEGKRIVSFNSRCFDTMEQKLPTIARELAGVIWGLQIYEHLILGSKFYIDIYTDHRAILFLYSKRSQLNHRYFKYQSTLMKYTNLRILWIAGKNLGFPDLLSRNTSLVDTKEDQLRHKILPRDIIFLDPGMQQVNYSIEHDEDDLLTKKM